MARCAWFIDGSAQVAVMFRDLLVKRRNYYSYNSGFDIVDAGRLTLTDHALYFEALRVVTYDKPKVYELAEDVKQVVKPELTGPWGSRLFDKAVLYKSTTL